VLLESAARCGEITLRFYQWAEPTLSLGYFQPLAERKRHAANCDCPVVRRSTGGGAIVHHHELTYSFAAPLGDRFSPSATHLYELLHGALIDTLAEWNITARLWGNPASNGGSAEPFLCFQRRAEFDVLIGESKIAGSAQRRRRGALLQHGSLLLATSPAAPELAGVAEISGVGLSATELAARWARRLVGLLETKWNRSELAADERLAAAALAEDKHASPSWLARR
jgi:lipoate-protein ligase A